MDDDWGYPYEKTETSLSAAIHPHGFPLDPGHFLKAAHHQLALWINVRTLLEEITLW